MPNLNPDSGLTLDVIRRIEAMLPELDTSVVVSFASVDEDLQRYFDTYGFNRLACEADYSLGFLTFATEKVATHFWHIENSSATVFVAHGLFDHVGLFLDVVEALVQAGYSVVAIDFPGHGLSEGERAVIGDFLEYANVIDEVMERLGESMPGDFYALGQSTGCAAILNYLLVKRGRAFKKLVLLAPLIQPRGWRKVSLSYYLLHKFVRFVSRSFTTNSHREGFCEFLADKDPLQTRHISVEWVGAMIKWVKSFDSYESVDIETIVIQGDADETVYWEKNIPRIEKKFPQCRTVMVEGAMHHLCKEGDAWQSQVFKQTIDFLRVN